MVRPDAMVRESDFEAVCCGVEVSVAVTVTVKVPAAVGVPPSTPARLRLMPAGSPVALQA
jgi:hypothetical protein